MILTISNILDPEQLGSIGQRLTQLNWTDGAATAGAIARRVKRNEQARLQSGAGAALRKELLETVSRHPVLRAAAQPARFSKPMISRTRTGGGYGLHMDNAFMGTGAETLRADLSYTLSLGPPQDYLGGELSIESPGQTQSFKPAAGELVLYPASYLHEVTTVTEGTRIVCVGWIESRINDTALREVLFDLENLRASLRETHDDQSPEQLTLMKTISNLLRRFGSR